MTITLNISTDAYLVLTPIPILWCAKLPVIKKIGLIVLFSGAIFVMIAGVLRCILILMVGRYRNPDSTPAIHAKLRINDRPV